MPYRLPRRHALAAAAVLALGAAPALAVDYTWNAGNLSATGVPPSLGATDTLAIGSGGYKYVDTGLATAGTVTWSDWLYFQNGNAVTNSGLWDSVSDAGLGDGGYGGTFNNSGSFRKSAGSGSTTIGTNVSFVNSGIVDARSGAITFAGGSATFNAGSRFIGAGSVLVTNNASFNGAFTSANLQLQNGTFTGGGAVLNGSVAWQGGSLAGSWQVAAGQALALQAGGYKYLNGSLTSAGATTLQDTLYLQNGNVLSNQALVDLQGDVGFGDGGYGGTLNNSGTLRKSAGSGASTISGIAVVNSGTVDVQTGTLDFASANATFNAGTTFSGAGQARITSNAGFAGSFQSSNLVLLSGTFSGSAALLNGQVSWQGGTLAGSWDIAAGQVLTAGGSGYKYVNGSVANHGTISGQDTLYFQNGNTLTNHGSYEFTNDAGLNDGGYSGTFVNHGTLKKSGGSTSTIANITLVNDGRVEAAAGTTIAFGGGSYRFDGGSQFAGAGAVRLDAGAVFVDAYTTAGNLVLNSGNFVGGNGSAGSKAVANGDTVMLGGTLAGAWEIASGRIWALQGGGYKYLNGSLNNLGTVAASDTLYLQNGNVLTNASLYDLKNDAGVNDGGYSGQFVNTGTLRKSGGATSRIVNIAFTNSGRVEAAAGNIEFGSGTMRFEDGSQFAGPGSVRINAGATFVGRYTTAGNLVLAAGALTGGSGGGSKASIDGDTTFAGGTLNGNWEVLAGRTLALQGNGYKYANASLLNRGTVAAQDTLYLQNGNTVTNQGRWDLQGDVGLADGGYGGTFLNQGLLVKSAGIGTGSVAGIGFVNAAAGVVDVQAGTLQLPNNFANQGLLKGVGAYATNVLSNDGHIAPGSGGTPGTLALAGSFVQGALGSFDVGLLDLSHFGLFTISGNAQLGGTIEVDCAGSCSFTAGTELVVLHAGGTLGSTFANLTTSGFAAGAFEVAYIGSDVVLRVTQDTVAAVPEPSTWALLLAGAAVVGGIARRRR